MTTTPEIPTQQNQETDSAATEAVVAADESTLDSPTQVALDRGREAAEKVGEAANRVGEVVGRAATDLVGRLRNSAELTEERGTTTIADEVVEKIAGIAAREVPGVHDLGGDVARVFASLRERIGLGETDNQESDRGVRVRLEGTSASVDMTIVIEFGYVVHSVTEAVRTKVISSIETMLGLQVTEVNIRVDDVYIADDAETPAA